jgi:hypothetical protein
MSIRTGFSASGLSIVVYQPIIRGSSVIDNFTEAVGQYSHTISANGGYVSASFTVMGNHDFVENWLQYGLGRHVVVYNPSLKIIWEGYVNEVSCIMGGATFSHGPLNSLGNRVSAMYTPIYDRCPEIGDPLYDPDCVETGEPITGSTTETTIVENEDSQRKYGIWEKVLNIGDAYTEDAEYIRDLYLEENSDPEWNPAISLSSNAGELSVKVECRGYIEWLSYVYNDDSDNQSVLCSELIKTILGNDPNGVFSTYYEMIEENLAIHDSQTVENKTAKSLIDEIVAIGGADGIRWTFGIYANRNAIYKPTALELEYIYYKTGKIQQVETIQGNAVSPWDVVPCKWVAIPSYLSSLGYQIEDLRNDPRAFFAEEVNFTAPDQVTISGAKIRKLPQLLARLGLGGV